jgi:hypothetical protein
MASTGKNFILASLLFVVSPCPSSVINMKQSPKQRKLSSMEASNLGLVLTLLT